MIHPRVAAAWTAVLSVMLAALPGCRDLQREAGQLDTNVLAERESHLARALKQGGDSAEADKPVARWILPATLKEISGLALTADGRLFAHGDEFAEVSELDYRRGVLVKQFTVGKSPVHGDFEGIAIAGERMYLLSSDGKIYEFREGANGTHVDFVLHDTKLGHECEFEGITFDPGLDALLLACKNVGTKHLQKDLVIYAWRVDGASEADSPEIAVPLKEVIGGNKWKDLHPSDITRDPANGNYVLVTAQEEALITLTPGGKVVASRPLPSHLEHTEGVAITRDSLLILSDEAGKQPAAISVYRWR